MPHTNPILAQAEEEEVQTGSSDKLKAVQEALAVTGARAAEFSKQMTENIESTSNIIDVIVSSAKEAAAASGVIALTQQNANLDAQNNTIAAFEAAGGTETQTRLMTQLQEDTFNVDTLLNEKDDIIDDEITGIGVVDKIINQFRSVQVNQEIKSAIQQRDQTVANVAAVTGATESFARISNLTKQSINNASIEANSRLIAAQGDAKAAQAELEGMASNSRALKLSMDAGTQQANNLLQAYRLEGEDEQRQLQSERTKVLKEQLTHDREKWVTEAEVSGLKLEQLRRDAKNAELLDPARRAVAEQTLTAQARQLEDTVTAQNKSVEAVQRGQATIGQPVEDRDTIIARLSNKGAIGTQYAKLEEMGVSPIPRIGDSPFEASEALDLVSPQGVLVDSPATRLIDTANAKAVETFAAMRASGKRVPTDKKELASIYNLNVKNFLAASADNIVAGDTTNPYQAPPMSVISEYKIVKESPLYIKVLEPAKLTEAVPQTVMDMAANASRAGTLTPEEASAGVVAIYKAAALYNSTSQGGLATIGADSQITYKTFVAPAAKAQIALGRIGIGRFGVGPSGLGRASAVDISPKKLNLMSSSEVQLMLVKMLRFKAVEVSEPNTNSAL